MVLVLQRPEHPSVRMGQQLAGIAQAGQEGYEKGKEKRLNEQEAKQFEKEFGVPFSLNPQIRKSQIAEAMKGKRKEDETARLMEFFQQRKGNKSTDKTFSDNILSSKKEPGSNAVDVEEEDFTPSEEDIILGTALNKPFGDVLGKIRKEKKEDARKKAELDLKNEYEERKIFESDRDFHTKVSRPIIEEAMNTMKSYEIVNNDLNIAENSIESGETSGIFPFLVEKMGLETFRNPESALFNNAIKNLFVASLNDIPGARPNQFIERYLSAAQPSIGRDKLANLAPIYLQRFREDIRKERAKLELEIAKEDREKYGYVKEDVSERASERMGDYVNRRQEQFATQLQNRKEQEMQDADILNEIVGKTVIPGTPLTSRSMNLLYLKNGKNLDKAVEEAESLGYEFPKYIGQ